MKKLNILFKRICVISLSSALFLGSINASAFTAGRQGDATMDIEGIETPEADSGSYMEENISFDNLNPVDGEKEYYGNSIVFLEDVDAIDISNQKPIEESENTEKVLEINETDSYIDEYYFSEAIEESIQTLSLDSRTEYNISTQANNMIAYFSKATNVIYTGNSGNLTTEGSEGGTWGKLSFVGYNNTSVDTSKYIKYENAVQTENATYDLIVYPFKGTKNAQLIINSSTQGKIPGVRINPSEGAGYNGYKLKITEHGTNSAVSMDVMLGMSDLDSDEYFILPSNFSPTHKGTNVESLSVTSPATGIRYRGTAGSNTNNEVYNTNCVIGIINIPTDGITIYYGYGHTNTSPFRASLAFDEIKDYIDNNAYTIQFNANGGSGSVPTTIMKYGTDTSTVMGDIGSTVPTRSGYTFKGWSATPTYSSSNKRIAYTAGDTGATTTQSTWSYATYCANTGGDSSNRTLALYAQWEPVSYSHTLTYDANGGNNAPSSSTVTNTSSTYSMTVSSSTPTRAGYTFAGWNTNSSGTGTNYSAGGSVSVGANATVTLYAKWTPITYSITYNGNGNTGGSTASQTKTYGVSINLQQNGFTRTGYHFTGWNTKANGTGTAYAAGAAYSTDANLTLYAQWTTNTSTLKVKPNGGIWWNGSSNEQSFTQNYNTTKSIPVPTRTGYTFTGWTRTGTNGTMSSLVAAATYTFGADNGTTDTITAGWNVNNYTVTYIDRIKGTATQLGTSSTASKPYGSTVRGSDKGSDTTAGKYHAGYYYVSDTSALVTTSGATVYRYFSPQNYTVTYIDRIKGTTTQLGTSSTASKPYGSTVRGSDKGSDTTVGIYHTGYYYVSDTSATVTTSGATVYRYFSPQNYTVTYVDRIKGTATQLGTSSTASKPFGASVRGADKGSNTTVGAYHTGYYYVSDTSATVTTSGATVYRYFSPQNYTVTYIDVVDSRNGKELGRSTAAKPYNSTVRGADKGSSGVDNAYYNGYYYFSDTSATVTTNGATVYRIFKQRMNTIAGNIIWIDWNNKNLSRPSSVNLYINGSDGSEYSYVITGSNSQNTSANKWPYSKELPKYDSNGNVITYTVSQDKAISQEEGLAYKDPVVNGYDVTNEITNVPEDYIKIPVTITWNDDNNQYGFRPAAVTLQLLRNGTVVKTISTSGNYTFTELLKYDSNGDLYAYTIQASDEDRYTKTENNAAPYSKSVTYTFIKPAYSVIIPKVVILDGNTGIGEYVVSVKGQIDDRDFVNVIPDKSFTMKNDYLSLITATVKQNRTVFTNKENIKAGAISNGTITTKSLAGRWSGSFNFNIYFEFGR